VTRPEASAALPGVVLDTNAVLDWLVFANDNMLALSRAIQAGQVRWMSSSRMREELVRTIGYATLSRWNPDSVRTLTFFDRWASVHDDPLRCTHGALVCSDPDDQVFIDLAVAAQARWLVTHDRALLKLKRAAKLRGVTVLQPAQWSLPETGP
jgi:putative PIN family toxin of toxin-antitoxin system